jgi:hypothetical protein
MKTFVDDLVTLVGGSGHSLSRSGAHGRPAPAASRAAGNLRHKGLDLERPVLNQRCNKTNQTNPEQIIPLEDDFKDF